MTYRVCILMVAIGLSNIAFAQNAVQGGSRDPQSSAQEATSAQAKSEYIARIRTKIQRFIVLPPNLQGNPEAIFDLVMLPDGHVLTIKVTRPSGNAAYDNAVERAISRAQPLPMPPDPALIKDFRVLILKFRAQD
ncbi:MAG: cell envelope integrity protein TolA [Betaproteobacteria bacterium]|nr:cell envelope integrity protein TolA [Betaproteobacteria bacterium]